jgi:CDP-glycerol glycerophosphotransferase (TagB/SpsB family)
MSDQMPEIDAVWLSTNKMTVKEVRSKGLKAYWIFSLKGVWFALTSKFWFFNAYSSDIMFCLSGNATLVNLWHGLPMKKIEFDIDSGPLADRYVKKTLKERFFHPESFKRPDYMLSASPMYSEMFSRAFRIDVSQCLELGNPRNDVLTWPEDRRLAFVKRYEPETTQQLLAELKSGIYNHIYIYLPTWRDSNYDFLGKDFDLKAIDKVMRECRALMIFKPHANTTITEVDGSSFTNVRILTAKTDFYPILPYTDVLITDYSSVLNDYLLMEKKSVVLYLFDYHKFTGERSFIWPFDEITIGKRVFDFEGLLGTFKENQLEIDEQQKENLVSKTWAGNVSQSSERVAGYFRGFIP